MKKVNRILIFICYLIPVISFSQNDTIWEYKEYIKLQDDILNQYDESNQKQGKWIYFIPKNTYLMYSVHEKTSRNPHIIKYESDSIKYTIYDDDYFIQAIGYYKDNQMDSIWNYYYINDSLQKQVYFNNGSVQKDFDILYDNGIIMMKVIKINNESFKVKKFSDNGEFIEEQYFTNRDIEKLLLPPIHSCSSSDH